MYEGLRATYARGAYASPMRRDATQGATGYVNSYNGPLFRPA